MLHNVFVRSDSKASPIAEDHGRTHEPLPKRKRAPQVASRSLLSFGDDMDIEEPEGSVFSLADRTQRKYAESPALFWHKLLVKPISSGMLPVSL